MNNAEGQAHDCPGCTCWACLSPAVGRRAKLLSKARRIATNIAKLPELLRKP